MKAVFIKKWGQKGNYFISKKAIKHLAVQTTNFNLLKINAYFSSWSKPKTYLPNSVKACFTFTKSCSVTLAVFLRISSKVL